MNKHGIEEEQSDIRAHVSFPGKRITVFQTADMVDLIKTKVFPKVTAGQPGTTARTAEGRLVPLGEVQSAFAIKSERYNWEKWNHNTMSLSEKGRAAVDCVQACIRSNKFPLWICGIINEDKDLDIKGTDIIVCAVRRIQVKYDWGSYPKDEGGRGGLWIQTHECNPLKIY